MENVRLFSASKEFKETIYSYVEANVVLRSYPRYRGLFTELRMPDECLMVGRIEELMAPLDEIFNFEVEFLKPGTLVDMHTYNKEMYMYRYYYGHLYPRADGKNMLKIEAVDNSLSHIDMPKALYEYGQMINYHVMGLEVEKGNHFHNTSAHFASLLMGYEVKNGDTEENVWALAFGKQFSGWVNAIWLAWMLGIDQHSLVMAMVMLEIEEMEDDEPAAFAEYIWVKYKDYLLDRTFAERHFKQAGCYTFSDFQNPSGLDETKVCQQIDRASANLFKIMIHDEYVRQAENESRISQSLGMSVNH